MARNCPSLFHLLIAFNMGLRLRLLFDGNLAAWMSAFDGYRTSQSSTSDFSYNSVLNPCGRTSMSMHAEIFEIPPIGLSTKNLSCSPLRVLRLASSLSSACSHFTFSQPSVNSHRVVPLLGRGLHVSSTSAPASVFPAPSAELWQPHTQFCNVLRGSGWC